MAASVLGCKWTLHVLGEVRRGVRRPSELAQTADGLSKKVLNDCLKKLTRMDLVERRAFAETPPRVEYSLTPFGDRFSAVLDDLAALQDELDRRPPA